MQIMLIKFVKRTMKNQKARNGEKQMMKASSNMSTPDAGLRQGGSISMLLRAWSKASELQPLGQGNREMELCVTPPTCCCASSLQPCTGNPPAA